MGIHLAAPSSLHLQRDSQCPSFVFSWGLTQCPLFWSSAPWGALYHSPLPRAPGRGQCLQPFCHGDPALPESRRVARTGGWYELGRRGRFQNTRLFLAWHRCPFPAEGGGVVGGKQSCFHRLLFYEPPRILVCSEPHPVSSLVFPRRFLLACYVRSNILPQGLKKGQGENEIDQVTMNEGKEGINIPSCSISSGSGSKKTLSLTNCSFILPVVGLLQMVWKTIASNQRRQACCWKGASMGPVGV